MGSRVRPLGAKVFLEGIEVPLIGATITSTVGQASIAYVDIVPQSQINHIKPRTHVLIAIRDYKGDRNHPTGKAPSDIGNKFPYVKAWEGEVFGFQFNKTATSRAMTLSCIDLTSYWDSALNYYFNAQVSLGRPANALAYDVDLLRGSGGTQINSTVPLTNYFIEKLKDYAGKKGVNVDPDSTFVTTDGDTLDIITALAMIMNETKKVNGFFRSSTERVKLIERIFAKSSGETSRLLQEQNTFNWFSEQLKAMSGFTTLRDVMNHFLSIFFHDQVTIPFPSGTRSGNTVTRFKEYLFKPNFFMLPPPMCNIFFPDEYSSFTYNRNFLTEPTRTIYQPELITSVAGGNIALPYAYAPANFRSYMDPKSSTYRRGTGDFDIPVGEDIGKYDSDFKSSDKEFSKIHPKQREHHFLTNEERIKGPLFSFESLVPQASAFRANLDDQAKANFVQQVAGYMLVKKRFHSRELQITSHLKHSLMPGFSALLLDDSPARQNIVAYVSSVTHRIYATEGGFTNVHLSYARTVEEQGTSNEDANSPLIPPWFQEAIFGKHDTVTPPISEDGQKEVTEKISGVTYKAPANKLSEYYKELIGTKGYKSITDYRKGDTSLVNSVFYLLADYKNQKKSGEKDILSWISTITDRDYVRVRDAFRFLGATTTETDFRENNFVDFFGGMFSEKSAKDPLAALQVKMRRGIILRYRDNLLKRRGHAG